MNGRGRTDGPKDRFLCSLSGKHPGHTNPSCCPPGPGIPPRHWERARSLEPVGSPRVYAGLGTVCARTKCAAKELVTRICCLRGLRGDSGDKITAAPRIRGAEEGVGIAENPLPTERGTPRLCSESLNLKSGCRWRGRATALAWYGCITRSYSEVSEISLPQGQGRWGRVVTEGPTHLGLYLLSAAFKRVWAKGWGRWSQLGV